jgi:hypothetical protein
MIYVAFGHAYKKDGCDYFTYDFEGYKGHDGQNQEQQKRNLQNIVKWAKQKNKGIKILTSEGRDVNGGFDYDWLKENGKPVEFAKSVAQFVKDNNLDGYDMNIESGNIDIDKFIIFWNTLRQELPSDRYILTMSPWSTNADDGNNPQLRECLNRVLDFVNPQFYSWDTDIESWFDKNRILGGWEHESPEFNKRRNSTMTLEKFCRESIIAKGYRGMFGWGFNTGTYVDRNFSDNSIMARELWEKKNVASKG